MTTQKRRPYRKGGAPPERPRQQLTADRNPARVRQRDEYLAHFAARVIQDAMAEATAAYWRRRAAAFEAACSRPGDYPGKATPEQVAERDARLIAAARACRGRAALSDRWPT